MVTDAEKDEYSAMMKIGFRSLRKFESKRS
jgi:hypothetical protein